MESPLCIQEPVDAGRITLIKHWESLDALIAHKEMPHMKAAGLDMKDLRVKVEAQITESIF